MNKKLTITIIAFLLSFVTVNAQNISVSSFKHLESDNTANTYGTSKKDMNGETAALIKIVTHERGFTFDGSHPIIGLEYHPGEIWLYVPRNSTKLSIKHPVFGVLSDYKYPYPVLGGYTFEMRLDMGKESLRTEQIKPNEELKTTPQANPSKTQAQNTIKFGTIDATSIMYAMPEMMVLQNKYDAKVKEYENEIDLMQKELMVESEAYIKQKDKLDKETAEEREQDLHVLNSRIEMYYKQSQEALNKMREEESKVIYEKIKKAIEVVGQKYGFIQIFDISANGNVVYYSPDYHTDVTPFVKKELGLK